MKIHHASSIRPIKNKLFSDEIDVMFYSIEASGSETVSSFFLKK
jgi:hypothetical protein